MENSSHASEQLNWMVPSDLRPTSPRRSCCLKTPILPSSTWKRRAALLFPGCLTNKTQKHPRGAFPSNVSGWTLIPSYCSSLMASPAAEPAVRFQAAMLAYIVAARSRLCVTRIEVRPWLLCSRSTRSKTMPAVISSRSPVGSSASSSRGLFTSARASATRCCSPPESSPGRWMPRSSKPTSLNQLDATPVLRASHSPRQQRHRHVFQRRKLRQQIMELPHVSDLPVAKGRCLPWGKTGHIG